MPKVLKANAIHNIHSSYPIYIGVDALSCLPNLLAQINPSFILILADEKSIDYTLPVLKPHLSTKNPVNIHLYSIPSGEKHKTLDTCHKVWQYMIDNYVDRDALIINLGGGTISDIGGLVAGLYKRGILFLNIPTTLLAQVDASIGGKVGVNLHNGKNQIGLFNTPEAVIADLVFLKTLPIKAFKSGYAEILKHGLIADKEYWKECKSIKFNDLTTTLLTDIIYRSCEIKKSIVEEDAYEIDIRKWLNFGHTVGHALESVYTNTETPLTHGEAIAIGMLIEAKLSMAMRMLSRTEFEEIENTILDFGYITKILPVPKSEFIKYLYQDKKNQQHQLRLTLLQAIGKAKENVTVTQEQLLNACIPYLDIQE
ncbi:MAG: 3-dehydroquinate synthase [Bacteroidia bacterium]|nr:3-dehydroquinate synthase [Bacteroidia bacterium]MDW8347234.1 3-dehydroquinate synthase [Bacteroidia bacterium]